MRRHAPTCLALVVICARFAWGEDPSAEGGPQANPKAETIAPGAPAGASDAEDLAALRVVLERNTEELQGIRDQQADEIKRLQQQVELQQKQIDVLQKTSQLLAEQLKKVTDSSANVEDVEAEASVAEARSKRAALRDKELADAVDGLRESVDTIQRNGTPLPAPLRETFLPTRTNESPLAIYGTMATDFNAFQDRPSNFPSSVFSPHFYLLLNERFLLEANPEFRAGGETDLESGQIDIFLTDNLTLIAGRFYSPLGFFNERLHTSWVFRTPDRPLMFFQVFPSPLSFNGVQLRGARYIAELPVKLEYSGVVSNGFSLAAANPTARNVADLLAMVDTINDVNGDKAYGGRLGLSFPTVGLIAGISGLANGAYDREGQHDLGLWDVDVSWHKGNWDMRCEYAHVNQQAPQTLIRRRGLYAQAAYRRYNSLHPILQRLEGVFRYDYVDFAGIDLAAFNFETEARERIPVDRSRYTIGLNYYFYPSLIFKVAYEINDELSSPELRDDGFLAQLTWGW